MDMPDTLTQEFTGLLEGSYYTVKVIALDSWGKECEIPLTADFATTGEAPESANPGEEIPTADVLDIQIESSGIKDVSTKNKTVENGIEITQTSQENADEETNSGSHERQGNMANETFNQTTIAGGYVENITNSITEALGDKFSAGQTESIVRQVIEQIKVTARENFSSIEINLNPENRGKVGISVASKNGVLTAQISVETEAAKNAIESQMAVLKESFNEQGIKIEDVEITLASHQFERNNESESRRNDEQKARKTTRRIRLEDIDALGKDEQEQEAREEQNRILMGNTINYSA
jgi:flagellar hook-length control protein FliK